MTDLPGPKSRQLREKESKGLASRSIRIAELSGIAVDRAQGSIITDIDGNRFIDLADGAGVGHSHPKWVRAVQEQAGRISTGNFTSAPRARLVERLIRRAPSPELNRVQLFPSSAEAMEGALALARAFTGNRAVVGFWGGDHGATEGARAPAAGAIPYADCYHCPVRLSYPGCGLACVELGRQQLKQQKRDSIAAFIVEPMQASAGNIIPPKEFLPAVKALARAHGALLIVDERFTAFGRTGKYWGVDHSGVEPDLLIVGESLSGGYPLGGLITRAEIAAGGEGSGGSPLASASADAVLSIVEDEGLVEHARLLGDRMLRRLQKFPDRFPFVGQVRGVGLMAGIELVGNQKTKEPLAAELTERFFRECLKRGLLTMAYSSSFRLQPPLSIDEATLDEALDLLEQVFEKSVLR